MTTLTPYMVVLRRHAEEDEMDKYGIAHMENIRGIDSYVMKDINNIIRESRNLPYFTLHMLAEFDQGVVAFTAILFRDRASGELWGMRERVRALQHEDWNLVDSLGKMFDYKWN